jgi:hypothetical protein
MPLLMSSGYFSRTGGNMTPDRENIPPWNGRLLTRARRFWPAKWAYRPTKRLNTFMGFGRWRSWRIASIARVNEVRIAFYWREQADEAWEDIQRRWSQDEQDRQRIKNMGMRRRKTDNS